MIGAEWTCVAPGANGGAATSARSLCLCAARATLAEFGSPVAVAAPLGGGVQRLGWGRALVLPHMLPVPESAHTCTAFH